MKYAYFPNIFMPSRSRRRLWVGLVVRWCTLRPPGPHLRREEGVGTEDGGGLAAMATACPEGRPGPQGLLTARCGGDEDKMCAGLISNIQGHSLIRLQCAWKGVCAAGSL